MNRLLRIGDLIRVPPVQTVISLEDGRGRSETISESFVFTSEVAAHFMVLADAFLKESGQGFFLQGDFGSGKSHFLASLTAWLADCPGTDALTERHQGLRRVKTTGRRLIPVDISLVRYRSTTPLEKILVEAVETALAACGVKQRLTPLAAFLSYFKNLLQSEPLASAFALQVHISPGEIDAYLQKDPRQGYMEGVRFMKSQGIEAPEALVEERYETFDRVIDAIFEAGFDGAVFLIDELSEFFRSKPDARALSEDARTLQLLGELAQRAPVWIIAALQESIERTGDIGQTTLRKIKDRFPVKFVLSTIHIQSLISQRLVKRKPGADEEIHRIYEYFQGQFPTFKWDFEAFRSTYPVHPLTLSLLDGLGDLFSVHRGIVDFVHSQIAGDTRRQIPGILERPCHELLGPDSIYEHFAQKMAEFSSFHVYPRHVIPHLDEIVQEHIEGAGDQALARRIVRILVLFNIHPTARVPGVKELTELVACGLSDQDPDLNVEFIAQAILDPIAALSKFLVKLPSDTQSPLDAVYSVITEEDPGKTLKARIARVASEIPSDDSRVLTKAFSALPESPSWPGLESMQNGFYRMVTWRQSSRRALILLLTTGEEDLLKDRIDQAIASGDIDFALVIGFGKTGFQSTHTAVWEIPLPLDASHADTLREFFATQETASILSPSNPAEAPLIQIAKEAVERLKPAAFHAVLDVFYSGRFADKRIDTQPVVRQMKRFDTLLTMAGDVLLEARYPRYKEIAPRNVSPVPMVYQRLLDELIIPGSITLRTAHLKGISDATEGLAMPLGLVELRSGSYVFSPDPERHPLLKAVYSLINPVGQTELSLLIHCLRTGEFGLPDKTIFFLLSALACGGLITLLKNGRAIALDFIRMSAVERADAVSPGQLIGKHDRDTLAGECTFLTPDETWESFGLRQQREAWQGVIRFKDWAKKLAAEVQKSLASMAEFSVFEAFDLDSVRIQLNALRGLSEDIRVSLPARQGLEQFLKAWRGSGLKGRQIDFLTKMRTFLNRRAEQFIFINHYIRHIAAAGAAAKEDDIAVLRDNVMRLLDHPENLVTDADPNRLADAFDLFRSGYAAYYGARHQEHYMRKPLSGPAMRALEVLKRLAAIEILDRPVGLTLLFNRLKPPDDAVCTRNLAEELMRSPVCNCGFIPGETPGPAKISNSEKDPEKNPEKGIENCIKDYLTIFKRPEIREALSARIFALTDAEPEAAKRLKSLNTFLEDESDSPALSGFLDRMDELTAGEISKSLSGRVFIERRGLTDLVSRLEGRRLSPDQVMETVSKWVSCGEKDTVIAIEEEKDRYGSDDRKAPSLSWWAMLHPELVEPDDTAPAREMEAALDRRFPALKLRGALARLDDIKLARFINEESFHSHAIRIAWLLIAERVLAGNPWPRYSETGSRHVDQNTAREINKRMAGLKRIASMLAALPPETLSARIPLSDILVDPWVSNEFRSRVHQAIQRIEQNAEDWLVMLSAVEPIDLSDCPVVLLLDGVSSDVWLEAWQHLKKGLKEVDVKWFRLDVSPKTGPAVCALFNISDDGEEAFFDSNILYYQAKGNEAYGWFSLLPELSAKNPVVIRISLLDSDAHHALMRLAEMPEALCRVLENELPQLMDVCRTQNRRLVVTTDHGLSLTRTGLSHGKGGVFERAVFRVQWPAGVEPDA